MIRAQLTPPRASPALWTTRDARKDLPERDVAVGENITWGAGSSGQDPRFA